MSKTVIVTGGAQGIGKGIAQKFFKEGFNVVLADHDEEAGLETVEEFNSPKVKFVKTDVSKEGDVRELINRSVESFGNISVLVNNAGITEFIPLQEITLDDWNRILGINLTSAFLCSKYAAKYLSEEKGRIINIASTRGLMSEPDNEAYSASKGGILALTHALANSLGPNVMVNSISPGWIDVSDFKKSSKREKLQLSEADHKQHLSGRVGTPEDIAETAFFLANNNGFITGQNFVVDGGMVKKMIYEE